MLPFVKSFPLLVPPDLSTVHPRVCDCQGPACALAALSHPQVVAQPFAQVASLWKAGGACYTFPAPRALAAAINMPPFLSCVEDAGQCIWWGWWWGWWRPVGNRLGQQAQAVGAGHQGMLNRIPEEASVASQAPQQMSPLPPVAPRALVIFSILAYNT
eukprot:1157660-Pelagomonas_calceolata.AAC.3